MVAVNGVMMQYFHWYLRAEDNLWQRVAQEAQALGEAGITALWLPPADKEMGGTDYDLDDLGTFDQKGTGRTKYGDRQEYLAAIEALHQNGIEVYADGVLNHPRGGRTRVFDVSLHNNFHTASRSGGNYDMRRILQGTLMQQRPLNAVTFVENHESQPLQALETPVEPWFKPLAYALILLRQEGYPCIFYADYYGATYEDYGKDDNTYRVYLPSHRWLIDIFLQVRRQYVYGFQYDYFDHGNCIGWTCLGNREHPKALAVIMSDGPAGWKWMEVGKPHAKFGDVTKHIDEPVYANEYGWAEFRCQGGSVSVWVQT